MFLVSMGAIAVSSASQLWRLRSAECHVRLEIFASG